MGDKFIKQYVFDAFDFWLSGDLFVKLEDSFGWFAFFMSNSVSNLAETFTNESNDLAEMVAGLGIKDWN